MIMLFSVSCAISDVRELINGEHVWGEKRWSIIFLENMIFEAK